MVDAYDYPRSCPHVNIESPLMQTDPRGTPEMRAVLIIGGALVFGITFFVILAGFLGANNAIIAIVIALAAAGFIIVSRYIKRRRMDKTTAYQPYRSAGTTRNWPQIYRKRERMPYNPAVNRPPKPEPTPMRRNLSQVMRFALEPLKFVWHLLNNRMEGDIKKDEILHRQIRRSSWW